MGWAAESRGIGTKEFKAATDELKLEAKDFNIARDDAIKAAQATKNDLSALDALLTKERDLHQKILALTTPRNITAVQISRISETINPFAKTPFDISVNNDPESIDFTTQLITALRVGEWDWKEWESGGSIVLHLNAFPDSPAVGTLTFKGCVIEILESDEKELTEKTITLAKVMQQNGVSITGFTKLTDEEAKRVGRKGGLIHILVGMKQ